MSERKRIARIGGLAIAGVGIVVIPLILFAPMPALTFVVSVAIQGVIFVASVRKMDGAK